MFAAWGRCVYRFRWVTLALSALLLAGSLVALRAGGTLSNTIPPRTESGRALRLIQDELPQPGGSSFALVFGSDALSASDPAFRDALAAAVAPLRSDARVKSIRTPADGSEAASGLSSRNGHRALVIVSLKDDLKTARSYYPQVRALVRSDTLGVIATGDLAINHDFDRYLEADLRRAEFVSLPLALIFLLFVFGTVVAALLPLGVGVLGVLGGLGGVLLLARVTDVSQYALNVVTLVGLGVAIDYSLFIVNRFREELARGKSVEESLVVTTATAGRAVTFSGLTVAIGLSGMLFYQGSFLASLGFGGAIVVGMAVFYALTFLPALLALLGPRVGRFALPLALARPRAGTGFWHGLATWVMRRPLLVAVPTLLLLALAGSPFLHLRLANGNVDMLPARAESRQGYDLLLQQFPGQDQTQISVVIQFPNGQPLTAARVGYLYDLSRRLEKLPDVLRVDGVVNLDPKLGRSDYQALLAGVGPLPIGFQEAMRQSVGEHVVVLKVLTARGPESDEARAIVRAVRGEEPPAQGRLLVTGETAFDIDIVDFILRHTPAAVAFVMLVTFFVLFLLVGSLILPLKAVVMNLVSISASFGALVWIFQQGHLSSVLSFTAASIDPSIPVILFCVVFGLSMDYEVMLLSRIQEEHRRTGDTIRAVAQGLERSGRLITGAAAIMVAVFAAFALADVVIIKSIGLGMAIAVAIDATLVRALLVPALMRLLGDWNWWAPRPLARLQRRAGLGEPVGAAVPSVAEPLAVEKV